MTTLRRLRARLARVLVVVAVALGGLVAGLVVAHLLRPSEGEIQAAARELVPPGAELVDVSEINGPSYLNGPYRVYADFQADAPSHEPVVAAIEVNASSRNWSLTGLDEAPNGTTRNYERDDLGAEVSVLHDSGRDAGIVEGVIRVQRDGDAQLRRQLTWGGAGAVVGLALSVAVPRYRDRPSREEPS